MSGSASILPVFTSQSAKTQTVWVLSYPKFTYEKFTYGETDTER